jgi:ceramide glucosyltransferase
LIPLCGAESGLYDSLRSFCRQDYPEYHLVFGVRSGEDLAVDIVNQLIKDFPTREITLVINAQIHGANLKVSNLINMIEFARYETIIMADSDIWAPSDSLHRVVQSLSPAKTGVATAVYTGVSSGGLAAHMGAMYINNWFLPSVLVDFALNGTDGCYGAIIGIKRKALESIGGLDVLSDYLAEDNRLGRLVRQQGYDLAFILEPVATRVNTKQFVGLFRQEIRWSRTVRCCRPSDHLLSLVTFPLPLMLILLALAPSWFGVGLTATHLLMQMLLNILVHRRIPLSGPARPWLVPLREILCFVVWVLSLRGNKVRWRDVEYKVDGEGMVVPIRHFHPKLLPELGAMVGEES